MPYYTERNGLRSAIRRSYEISMDAYAMLFDCCQKYQNNIAWKFPDECPDGLGCCGLDQEKLDRFLKYRIPTLFRDEYGRIACPAIHKNLFDTTENVDSYDQYALLDLIEFFAEHCKEVVNDSYHSYFGHYHLSFNSNEVAFRCFQKDINGVFEMAGLLYHLTDEKIIERIVDNSILTPELEANVTSITEKGTRDLLMEAIALHRKPHPEASGDAVEKLWDAFERLKTYYTNMSKKDSADKIIQNIAANQESWKTLLSDEYKTLTNIGNNYRIRHHETDKIEITDTRHYDYLFNRCLSLIALSILYLK